MTFFVRNKSGGPAQLPTINVTADVPNGGDVDLVAVQPNGLPLNYTGQLYEDEPLREAIGAGTWAVLRNGVELPPADGLTVLQAASAAATDQDYANTIYVDPNGDASFPGTSPSQPTSFANAIATATFSTNIVLAEGVYTTGAGVTIPADNVTFTARQGGTQSNSVIIQDAITLGSGRTRFRAYGVRFDGGFVDTSAGRHYFSACSAGGGSYNRTNPTNFMVWKNCDFAAMTYTATGVGSGSLTVEGAATVLSAVSSSVPGATIEIHEALTGRITMVGGALVLSSARVQDATLAIDADATTTVQVFQSRLTTVAGASVAVSALGTYWFGDVVYDETASALGTPVGTPAAFSADLRYKPTVPGDYTPAVSSVFAALDQLAARPAGSFFGEDAQVFIEVQPTTVSGGGFVPVLPASVSPPVITTPLKGGAVYRFSFTASLRPTSGAGRAGAQLLLDFGGGFVAVGAIDARQAGTGGGAPTTGLTVTVDVPIPAGPDIAVGIRVDAQEYAIGSWANFVTRVELWRIS